MEEIGCSLRLVVAVKRDAQANLKYEEGKGETLDLLATPSLKGPIRLSVMHPQHHDHDCCAQCLPWTDGARVLGSNPSVPAVRISRRVFTGGTWTKGKVAGILLNNTVQSKRARAAGSKEPLTRRTPRLRATMGRGLPFFHLLAIEGRSRWA